jgi:hypothetical protein
MLLSSVFSLSKHCAPFESLSRTVYNELSTGGLPTKMRRAPWIVVLLLDWIYTGNMTYAREFHTASVLGDGKVLVAGGTNAFSDLSSAELYNPLTGRWTTTNNMTTTRVGHTASVLADGKVLVAGGGTATAELYDPSTGRWIVTRGGRGTIFSCPAGPAP